MTDINKRLKAFIAANDKSPVVSGFVLDKNTGGARYTLEDGRRFTLPEDERRELPAGYPKWKGVSDGGA